MGTYVRASHVVSGQGPSVQSSAPRGCVSLGHAEGSVARDPSSRDTQATDRVRDPGPHGALHSDQSPT
jgi:hypothetical protein